MTQATKRNNEYVVTVTKRGWFRTKSTATKIVAPRKEEALKKIECPKGGTATVKFLRTI